MSHPSRPAGQGRAPGRPPLRIGIAGAGIGGLAAAALLAQDGHAVTVFDQFAAPRAVGSGLVIQPVGQAVLQACGALEAARAAGQPIWHMLGTEADSGRRVLDVTYGPPGGASFGLSIHRAALFHPLLDAARAAGAAIETGARVTGHGGGRFQLATGAQTPPFDLLIDAAGAGSPLSPLRSRALPFGALWATVPIPQGAPLPHDELRQVYRRADRMLGVMPLGRVPGQNGDHAAIFWSLPEGAFARWQAAGLPAWQAEATALWPDFAPYAAQITDPDQMTHARYSHGTLARPWGSGIAHIGDAAHRASPQLGQGANMALLDARVAAGATPHRAGGCLAALCRRAALACARLSGDERGLHPAIPVPQPQFADPARQAILSPVAGATGAAPADPAGAGRHAAAAGPPDK